MTSRLFLRKEEYLAAKGALLVSLIAEFPIGTAVVYRLRGSAPEQIGEVVGYAVARPGFLRVKLARARHDRGEDNRYITSMPFTKIVRKV